MAAKCTQQPSAASWQKFKHASARKKLCSFSSFFPVCVRVCVTCSVCIHACQMLCLFVFAAALTSIYLAVSEEKELEKEFAALHALESATS